MILLDISRYKCPNCKKAIEVDQLQDFNTRFCKREVIKCPFCSSKLNWEKTTHSLAHYSMWLAFLTMPLPFLGLYSIDLAIWVLFFFMILSGVSMMMKHLVEESAEK